MTPEAPAQAATLTIDFTTSSQNGRYAPRNVGAVWINTASGQFVKTLERWAGIRARYLVEWNAASGGWPFATEPSPDQLDAISGATLRAHETHHLTWDLKGLDGQFVPDGRYQVVIEVTDDEERPGAWVAVDFEKGPVPQIVTPPDELPCSDLTIGFQP